MVGVLIVMVIVGVGVVDSLVEAKIVVSICIGSSKSHNSSQLLHLVLLLWWW